MKTELLIGSYAARDAAGVHGVIFDSENGFVERAAGKGWANPSYVLPHPNGKRFYAVEENAEGGVCAGDAGLCRREAFATGGASPCHLALSEDARWLYAANYMSGSVAVFALDADGSILRRADLIAHAGHGPNPARQEGPHAHFCMAAGREVFVCDLGIDAIVIYRNDDGRLRETGRVAMPPGSGPRHLARDPKRPGRMYCVAEMGNRVFALEDGAAGWRIIQSASTLPEDFSGESTAAAIRVTPDGACVLASNRGHDSIAAFPVGDDGRLGAPVVSPVASQPRDFILCGDFVIAASQRDDVVRAYQLDRNTLRLTDAGMALSLQCPVCLAEWKQ